MGSHSLPAPWAVRHGRLRQRLCAPTHAHIHIAVTHVWLLQHSSNDLAVCARSRHYCNHQLRLITDHILATKVSKARAG